MLQIERDDWECQLVTDLIAHRQLQTPNEEEARERMVATRREQQRLSIMRNLATSKFLQLA